MMKKSLFACLLSSALVVGCGNTSEADTEGCEHLKEGPGVSVTATATANGAPAVSNDHKRYDIALPAGTGGNTGSVSFAVGEAAHYVFFLGADVNLGIATSAGSSSVSFESSEKSSEACGEVKGRYVAELQVGTYTLTFGPTSQSSVSLVIEEEGGEHDHEH
ncbi:hypothetical protein [Archangium lipolyticum]|uniref:hypothetical protein n=1 Tax=Archangium lipolyticum TaxID=2970465 RepID=UPI002149E96E|nr:hypothetical protein [Archangium lipolyticum]